MNAGICRIWIDLLSSIIKFINCKLNWNKIYNLYKFSNIILSSYLVYFNIIYFFTYLLIIIGWRLPNPFWKAESNLMISLLWRFEREYFCESLGFFFDVLLLLLLLRLLCFISIKFPSIPLKMSIIFWSTLNRDCFRILLWFFRGFWNSCGSIEIVLNWCESSGRCSKIYIFVFGICFPNVISQFILFVWRVESKYVLFVFLFSLLFYFF